LERGTNNTSALPKKAAMVRNFFLRDIFASDPLNLSKQKIYKFSFLNFVLLTCLAGLFAACIASTTTKSEFESELLEFLKIHCPPKSCPLAGSSIHCDKEVLRLKHPEIYKFLHHRIIDVSTIAGVVERWMPETWAGIPRGAVGNHRTTSDIEASIGLLKWFRANVMRDLP
jgi:oligoribonuclease (3'-5' exoribonuclease)